MLLDRKGRGRRRNRDVEVRQQQDGRRNGHEWRRMHLIGVRVLQGCAAIVVVSVAVVVGDQAEIMVVMIRMVVRMMMRVTYGGLGLSPFRRGVPSVIVMHMLAAEAHRRRNHARDWSHDQRDDKNEDREPAHVFTIAEGRLRATEGFARALRNGHKASEKTEFGRFSGVGTKATQAGCSRRLGAALTVARQDLPVVALDQGVTGFQESAQATATPIRLGEAVQKWPSHVILMGTGNGMN